MPPKAQKEVIFMLVGTGEPPPGGDVNYFAKAIEVVTLTLQKKIVLKSRDEVGIILGVSGDDDFRGKGDEQSCIEIYSVNEKPSWQMVEDVQSLVNRPREEFQDWFTAISNTLKEIENVLDATRIILILLFDCYPTFPGIDRVDVGTLGQKITELEVDLLWIGSKPLQDISKDSLYKSEQTLMRLVKTVNGEYMTMEKILPSLRIYKNLQTKTSAWACDLQIGQINIPVEMYVQATKPVTKPLFRSTRVIITDQGEQSVVVADDRCYVDKYKEPRSRFDTISGYMYGNECIPVPDSDKAAMKYNGGPKSLKLYGFVRRKYITLEDLCCETSRIVVPGSSMPTKAFDCLVRAMNKKDRVAIVRRQYRADLYPKMGLLFPHTVPGEPFCFLFIEIPYREDRRVQTSCPLDSSKKRLSKEQVDAVGNLIESMMLTSTSDDEPEPFVPGSVYSPGLQHIYHCLVTRCTNPESSVPEMAEYLKNLIEPPESIKINRKPALEILKNVCPTAIEQVSTQQPEDTITVELPVQASTKANELDNEKDVTDLRFSETDQQGNVNLDELFEEDMPIQYT